MQSNPSSERADDQPLMSNVRHCTVCIIKAGADQAMVLNRAESRLPVESELVLNLSGGKLEYEVVAVAPYEKVYPRSEPECESTTPGVSFFAYSGSEVVGQIALCRNWNDFAYVNHLVVESAFRRSGIGCALVLHAIEWSQAERLAGVMLETQNTNVAACKLYERCGFRLRGFDQDLYRGREPDTREIALFWYWHPRPWPTA